MESRIRQAIILSAGLGTRLREITGDHVPKVMSPLAGKPILEWHIERLKSFGVDEIFINLFCLPDVIQNYFGDGSKWGVEITYVLEEPEIRGTAGGVKNFEEKLGKYFFVVYGDVFNFIDFRKMEAAFFAKPDAVAMTVVGVNDHPYDSDLVEVRSDMRFVKVYPKPHKELPARHASQSDAGGPKTRIALRAAAFIFKNDILQYIPPKAYYEIDHELLPDLIARGKGVYGYECTDYIKDIGTPERYKAVQEYFIENKLG